LRRAVAPSIQRSEREHGSNSLAAYPGAIRNRLR
jgi:hypothetical protein